LSRVNGTQKCIPQIKHWGPEIALTKVTQ
jgi:hypothetical protein